MALSKYARSKRMQKCEKQHIHTIIASSWILTRERRLRRRGRRRRTKGVAFKYLINRYRVEKELCLRGLEPRPFFVFFSPLTPSASHVVYYIRFRSEFTIVYRVCIFIIEGFFFLTNVRPFVLLIAVQA